MTWSMDMPSVSRRTASGACTSGAAAREQSRRSRSRISAAILAGSRLDSHFLHLLDPAAGALLGGGGEKDFDLRVREYDRADVSTFHDYAAGRGHVPLKLDQPLADPGNRADRRRGARGLGAANGLGDVFAVGVDMLLAVDVGERDFRAHGERDHRLLVGDRLFRPAGPSMRPRDTWRRCRCRGSPVSSATPLATVLLPAPGGTVYCYYRVHRCSRHGSPKDRKPESEFKSGRLLASVR